MNVRKFIDVFLHKIFTYVSESSIFQNKGDMHICQWIDILKKTAFICKCTQTIYLFFPPYMQDHVSCLQAKIDKNVNYKEMFL